MTAAETGHLVISTLHTTGVVNTVDRIIDVFPADQQQQIRVQLSMILQTVVSQHLLPNKSGGLIPAFEIMKPNNAIRNLIRESKIHQIDGVIQTSRADGMISMDTSIYNLLQAGHITKETALSHAANSAQMAKRLGM
jgi:twitching motility protein PilT